MLTTENKSQTLSQGTIGERAPGLMAKLKHIELFATSIIFTLSFLKTILSGLPIVKLSGVPTIWALLY